MRTALLTLAALAAGCTTPPPTTVPVAAASPAPSSAPLTTLGDEGCARADAVPALDPARVTAHTFSRGLGPRAVETASLAGGVAVSILHTGCDHYVERYSFRLAVDGVPKDGGAWLGIAAGLFKTLPVNADHAGAVTHWSELLKKRAAEKPVYALGEEIAVDEHSRLSLEAGMNAGDAELQILTDTIP